MADRRPIGVLDSGVGGLSVLPHLRSLLPAEAMLYAADAAWCPYGPRPAGSDTLRGLAERLRDALPRGRLEPVPGHPGHLEVGPGELVVPLEHAAKTSTSSAAIRLTTRRMLA